MKYIKTKTLTPHEARELQHILEDSDLVMIYKAMHLDGTDTYKIYQKED